MNKLFVIHYYPIDYFPPVMNLIDSLGEKVEIRVSTLQKSNSLDAYGNKKAKIYRRFKENKKRSSLFVLVQYIFFSLFTLYQLIRQKPDAVLYYESISAFPAYLYKRFVGHKVKLCIHYHEYMTPAEYCRPGMRLSKLNHSLETSYLYHVATWVSQTNQYRREFFMNVEPQLSECVCHILPNYPPASWFRKRKLHANEIVKCVYVGSLSLTDTYVLEFCQWIAKQHGIEWEQKGTHEEHLDVYNFKKKERKKEVQELEQEKEYLTAENEELTAQIAEFRADIQILKDDKEQAIREKQEAEQRAEDAEKEVKSLEERRDVLQPIMDNASKEIKEYGMIKTFLPEAGTFERAVPYRENKIKPLFIKMKNQIAALAGKVVELNKTVENWKNKYQKSVEKCDNIQKQLDDVRKENGKLSNDNQRLQEISDRYDRVVRILGTEVVEDVVQQDIKEQKELEEQRRMEQMPKGSVLKQLEWATQKSQIENQQRKKNKTKYKGLEI